MKINILKIIISGLFAVLFLYSGRLILAETSSEKNSSKIELVNNFPNENMIYISSSEKPFYIDKYEVSMVGDKEFFSLPNQIPAVNLTQMEAQNYCSANEKRLCTAKEWESACLGIHFLEYSYGNTSVPGFCNIENISRDLSFTGKYSHCKSEYEVYDMIGNALEITADKNENGLVIAKGGDYSTSKSTCFTRYYISPEQKNNKLGFRCCKDAEK